MNFAELLEEVLIWTKRPDLASASSSAVRRNTLKYHRREKWFKDLTTVTLTNPSPNDPVTIISLTSVPRLRQIAKVQADVFTPPFKPITVDDLLDLDGYARYGVYLVAGTNLNIKNTAGFPTVDLTYYQDPVATEDGYTSWIADEYPDLIVAASAAEVLAFDNESEIYKAAKQTEGEQFAILRMNNLEVEAR